MNQIRRQVFPSWLDLGAGTAGRLGLTAVSCWGYTHIKKKRSKTGLHSSRAARPPAMFFSATAMSLEIGTGQPPGAPNWMPKCPLGGSG